LNGISIKGLVTENSGHALIVSNSSATISSIEKMLAPTGISTVVANTEDQAFYQLSNNQISCILIESGLTEAPCNKFIRALRIDMADQYIPIIILATTEDEEQLSYCMSAGCDDVLFKPFSALALNSRISSLEKTREIKGLYKASLNEQVVARRILMNAIEERSIRFDEIDLLSRSKAIFSGDLFLTARHPDGSVNILLADFTGHGLPSAIGALPVADVFSAMTEKGFELGYILENINNKLHTLLPTSMFMACSVLSVSSDLKNVKIWNGGMPDIYIRAADTGEIRHKIQSADVPLGITDTVSDHYKLENVDLTSGDQLIVFTDGLTESLNKDGDMFGESRLEDCLRKNNQQASIFSALVDTFDEFRGDVVPMDDVTLACIPCTGKLMYANNVDLSRKMHIACSQDNHWHWYMELGGSSLRKINPVQTVIDEIHKISGRSANTDELSNIMSVLYKNVIEQKGKEHDPHVTRMHRTRKTFDDSHDIYTRIGIKKIFHHGIPALLVHMEASGREFTQDELLSCMKKTKNNIMDRCDEEFPLVYELNKLSRKKDSGNHLEAIIFEYDQSVNNYG